MPESPSPTPRRQCRTCLTRLHACERDAGRCAICAHFLAFDDVTETPAREHVNEAA